MSAAEPLKCPNKKCGATLMQEVQVAKYWTETEEDPEMRPETNRLNQIHGTYYFVYKCAVCGQQAWPLTGK